MPHPLNIAITCYPTVGGSGVLATALGEELATRGHNVHFIAYERPFRLPHDMPRLHFHSVTINDYGLFKYPDYTLPLSVRMADVSRDFHLDILHVHYAVPHATAAILARDMLPPERQPKIITTLHGTDTTLLGADKDYGPAIKHALLRSDAVTTVSEFLKAETRRLLSVDCPIDVIPNFFPLRPPRRSRDEMRRELGLTDNELLLLHCSNLRPVKRIDLLLETVARIKGSFKLVILAAGSFAPYAEQLHRLNLQSKVIVLEKSHGVEDYVRAADLALYTSESESFCLGVLEAMWFAVPSVAMRVGGIPEVLDEGVTGLMVDFGDVGAMAGAISGLMENRVRRLAMGEAGRLAARQRFAAEGIVSQYEALYRRVVGA